MASSTRSPCFGFLGKRKTDSKQYLLCDNITPELRSVSCTDATSGLHHFEIRNYSLTKWRGVGTKIFSSAFSVGGHEWRINCYLDGDEQQSADYISVYLQYCSSNKAAKPKEERVRFSFSLLDHTTGAKKFKLESKGVLQVSSCNSGWRHFVKRDILEASSCLKNDCLTIICDVTVIREPQTSSFRQIEAIQLGGSYGSEFKGSQ